MTVEVPGTETTTTVQGDPFCACGLNLHGLAITRDDRTGLPLARCPECGRFHASGAADTVVTQWAARFYAALVIAWVVGLLLLAGVAAGIQGSLNILAAQEVFRPDTYSSARENEQIWQLIFLLMPLALGGFVGLLQSVALWHVRGLARAVPILAVLLVGGLVAALNIYDSYPYRQSGNYGTAQLICLGVSGVTLLGCAMMLVVGRPLARAVASIAVSPKARRSLAFLWTADGKALPESNQ